jgi:hypothetical protein
LVPEEIATAWPEETLMVHAGMLPVLERCVVPLIMGGILNL